jgi:hypothetical protein
MKNKPRLAPLAVNKLLEKESWRLFNVERHNILVAHCMDDLHFSNTRLKAVCA